MHEIVPYADKEIPFIPFDLQLALRVTGNHHILSVKDTTLGNYLLHYYDGKRYVPDSDGRIIRGFIKDEILSIVNQPGVFQTYQVEAKELQNLARSITYFNTLTNQALKDINDILGIKINEDEFDADPYEINTQSGIYNILEGKLYPHSPDKLLRNITNAKFIEADEEDLPLEFIRIPNEALYDPLLSATDNQEILDSFMSILASCIVGHNEHKFLPVITGESNTGKSTFLSVFLNILGSYGTPLNAKAIMFSPRSSSDIRPDLISLKGKRFGLAVETGDKDRFDTTILKNLAGNDEVPVRKPHQGENYKVKVNGKVILATNFCPRFSNIEDKAFLNRVVLIDFKNPVPSEKMDPNLSNKLLEETSRDRIFTYLAKIATKSQKSRPFIHKRFEANKQRILVSQQTSVSRFWKRHISPLNTPFAINMVVPKHPVQFLYSILYIPFCTELGIKPLLMEAFAKNFKEIADATPYVMEKRDRESSMFYVGFTVINAENTTYPLGNLLYTFF